MERCRNCDAPLAGRYCTACGQDEGVERLTLGGMGATAVDALFSLESRTARTVLGLTRSPGRVAADYVGGRRARYVHPLRYYVVCVAVAVVAARWAGVDAVEGLQGMLTIDLSGAEESVREGYAFVERWMSEVLLAGLPLLAFLLRWFFPRAGRNVTECLVFALYAIGHAQLLAAALLLARGVAPELVDAVRRLVTAVLLAWGAVVFFRAGVVSGALRTLLATVLYLAVAAVTLLVLAALVVRT